MTKKTRTNDETDPLAQLKQLAKQRNEALECGDFQRVLELTNQTDLILNSYVDAELAKEPDNHGFHAAINRHRSGVAGVRHLKTISRDDETK